MAAEGEVLFDRSKDDHDEVWDDTELIRAYDRAHRQIQTRLRNSPKTKKKPSSNKKDKSSPSTSKEKRSEVLQAPTTAIPLPLPPHMISPPKDEQDAYHSMLMAWYMAGYHAGQLAAKNRPKNT